MKTKRIVYGAFILVLTLLTLTFASAETFYQDSPYGLLKIDIEKPSLFSTLFASFLKTTVYNGEQVEIYDGVSILGGSSCRGVAEWYICVYKDGDSCEYGGNLASGAENIGGCNFDLYVSWVTNEPGNYNLRSKIKSGGSTSYSYNDGDNTLTVLEQTPTQDCEWQGWTLFRSITNGYIKWNEYKDLDLSDNNNCPGTEYKTYCDDGYHATGTSDGTRIANGALLCLADSGSGLETCSQQGGTRVNSMDECNPGTMVDASDTPFCCVRQDDGGGNGGGGNGGTLGKSVTLTINEYYSTADLDIWESSVCNIASDCNLVEDKEVVCEKSKVTDKRIYNGKVQWCKENTAGGLGGLIGAILNLVPKLLIGQNICELSTSQSDFIIDLFDNRQPGICIAKSNSGFEKTWESYLDAVAGIGVPYNYVMLAGILGLLIIAMILFGAFK